MVGVVDVNVKIVGAVTVVRVNMNVVQVGSMVRCSGDAGERREGGRIALILRSSRGSVCRGGSRRGEAHACGEALVCFGAIAGCRAPAEADGEAKLAVKAVKRWLKAAQFLLAEQR